MQRENMTRVSRFEAFGNSDRARPDPEDSYVIAGERLKKGAGGKDGVAFELGLVSNVLNQHLFVGNENC